MYNNIFIKVRKNFAILSVTSVCLLLTTGVYAGNDNPHGGARDMAVAGASVTFSDAFCMFNNIAGMAWQQGLTAGLSNEIRFGLKELTTSGLAVSYNKTGLGAFGLGIKYFGYKQYNEQNISLGYARMLSSKISGGIQFHYLTTNLGDAFYENRSTLTVSLGMQYKVMEKLQFGFYIFNPTRNKLSTFNNERFPTILKAGFCWKPNANVLVAIEDEKNVDGKNILKGGVEYHIAKPLYIRTGIAGSPANSTFGIGIDIKNLKIDVAANYHPVLGFTPHFAIAANF